MSDTKQIWFVETEIVYKEVLDHVITNLNRIHNVDSSKRFWDIFIGAWLREFVELVMLRINECEHGQSHTTESGKISPIISLSDYRRLSQQTDFVEGLRPTKPDVNGNIGFELKNGTYQLQARASVIGRVGSDYSMNLKDNVLTVISEESNIG